MDIEKDVGKYKFAALKESLTIFTNPEENGYPAHQKLRSWLKDQHGTIGEIIASGEWEKYL